MCSIFQTNIHDVEKLREKPNLKLKETLLPAVAYYSDKIHDIQKSKNNIKEVESKKEKAVEDLKKATKEGNKSDIKKISV